MVEINASGQTIAGIILAGGQAKRLGGGKPFRLLGGKPLLAHVIARAAPQVASLAINANGDPSPFARFGLPVVSDTVPGFPGPLAGILAGMDWAAAAGVEAVASFACDAPFFPLGLVTGLAAGRGRSGAAIACAAAAGRRHPVFALWPVALREELRHAITVAGARQVAAWAAHYGVATVPFAAEPVDPFFNINTPADLATAETLLAVATRADNGRAGDKG